MESRSFAWKASNNARLKRKLKTNILGLYLKTATTEIATAVWERFANDQMYERNYKAIVDTPRVLNNMKKSVSFSRFTYDLSSRRAEAVFVHRLRKTTLVYIDIKALKGPGHAVLLAKCGKRLFLFDPNGSAAHLDSRIRVDESGSSSDPSSVAAAFSAVGTALFGASPSVSDAESWLLPSEVCQNEAIRFMDSEGVCAAFVSFVASLIVTNPAHCRRLGRYVAFRQNQWNALDSPARVQKVAQKIARLPDDIKSKMRVSGRSFFTNTKLTCVSKTEVLRLEEQLRAVKADMKGKAGQNYNALVSTHNGIVRELNDASRRRVDLLNHAFKYPVEALAQCEDLKNEAKVEEALRFNLLGMKLEGYSKSEMRLVMLKRGVLLSWLEVQLCMYMAYCGELAEQLNALPDSVEINCNIPSYSGRYIRKGDHFERGEIKLIGTQAIWVLTRRNHPRRGGVVYDDEIYTHRDAFPPWEIDYNWQHPF